MVEGAAGAALDGAAEDPDLAETAWCAYAWPASYQQSGNRTFFVNQAGDVLATENTTPPLRRSRRAPPG
ncbi:MAG: DUF2950 family protein [Planctomycetes bacterium]|nr:DUF2950 family protein [Planctomycetota bacterium]